MANVQTCDICGGVIYLDAYNSGDRYQWRKYAPRPWRLFSSTWQSLDICSSCRWEIRNARARADDKEESLLVDSQPDATAAALKLGQAGGGAYAPAPPTDRQTSPPPGLWVDTHTPEEVDVVCESCGRVLTSAVQCTDLGTTILAVEPCLCQALQREAAAAPLKLEPIGGGAYVPAPFTEKRGVSAGTRADFYVGRGKTAEWCGSIAWDGFPGCISSAVLEAKSEPDYRDALASFLQRDDATLPADGWPWPWDDSGPTDYSYAFNDGKVWATCYGQGWFDPLQDQPADVARVADAEFPDMSQRKAATLGAVRIDRDSDERG